MDSIFYKVESILLDILICPMGGFVSVRQPLFLTTAFSFLGLLNVESQNNSGMLDYAPDDIVLTQTLCAIHPGLYFSQYA